MNQQFYELENLGDGDCGFYSLDLKSRQQGIEKLIDNADNEDIRKLLITDMLAWVRERDFINEKENSWAKDALLFDEKIDEHHKKLNNEFKKLNLGSDVPLDNWEAFKKFVEKR